MIIYIKKIRYACQCHCNQLFRFNSYEIVFFIQTLLNVKNSECSWVHKRTIFSVSQLNWLLYSQKNSNMHTSVLSIPRIVIKAPYWNIIQLHCNNNFRAWEAWNLYKFINLLHLLIQFSISTWIPWFYISFLLIEFSP